jgi:hypothetical protein
MTPTMLNRPLPNYKSFLLLSCIGYLLHVSFIPVAVATEEAFKQPHLPPMVQPNGFLPLTVPQKTTTEPDDASLETVELVDTPSLVVKQAEQPTLTQAPTLATPATNHTSTSNSISVKELQLTAFNTLQPKEQLGVLEQQIQEADLQFLWNSLVERNPVVRFSLEKIALPLENHDAHSSQFLRKSLSVLISGAALGSSLVLPTGGYESMGILAGSQAVQNLVNGRTKPISNLTATEHIQLANLVDDLKRQLVENYQVYQQNLRAVQQAQPNTQRAYQHYQTAIGNQNPIEILTSLQVYHQSLKQETLLKQQAKLARIKLERLCGQPAVNHLVLVTQPMIASVKTGITLQQTAVNIHHTVPKNITNPATQKSIAIIAPPKSTKSSVATTTPLSTNHAVGAAANITTPIKSKPIQPLKNQAPNASTSNKTPVKLHFKEDSLF